MSTDLVECGTDSAMTGFDDVKAIAEYLPEHADMLADIKEGMPEIIRATSLFGKSQTQCMDNNLTVTHLTKHRNVRQILAEVTSARSALREAHFGNWKKSIEVQMKREEAKEEEGLKRQLLEVEALELESQLEETKLYVSGAIRKVANYLVQYNSILESKGIKGFNEVDVEEEEEEYHIMKAFEQGLCAARAHGGFIDEGNQIYLFQLGINGGVAQALLSGFLAYEQRMMMLEDSEGKPKEGQEPSHELVLKFLQDMAKKFKGCTKKFAQWKGMTGTITESAALREGDTRLLLNSSQLDFSSANGSSELNALPRSRPGLV